MNLCLCGSCDIYPIEYTWTTEETNVTTTSITDERASILIDQLTLNDPEFIQVSISKLFVYPSLKTLKKIKKEKIEEIETNKLVKISEFLEPKNFQRILK